MCTSLWDVHQCKYFLFHHLPLPSLLPIFAPFSAQSFQVIVFLKCIIENRLLFIFSSPIFIPLLSYWILPFFRLKLNKSKFISVLNKILCLKIAFLKTNPKEILSLPNKTKIPATNTSTF